MLENHHCGSLCLDPFVLRNSLPTPLCSDSLCPVAVASARERGELPLLIDHLTSLSHQEIHCGMEFAKKYPYLSDLTKSIGYSLQK